MATLICFAVFGAAIAASLIGNWPLVCPIWLGILLFTWLGKKRDIPLQTMWHDAWRQCRKMCTVLPFYVLIGCMTGLWRSGGTIAFFIYYGTRMIRPGWFILVTFLLTSLISYALGTSFGVVGTAGIILMALGRSGGVDPALTAGTILSGAYFGDRCSPASSSAALVAAATGTELRDNLKMMRRTGWLPLLVTTAAYTVLSLTHPITGMEGSLLSDLAGSFHLSLWAALPALVMIVLPLCRVSVRLSMALSAACAFLVTVFLQGAGIPEALRIAVMGYHPAAGALQQVLSGGGMISMVECSAIAVSTGLYAGLLGSVGALDGIRAVVRRLAEKTGVFPATAAAYLLIALTFCNQSTGAVMTPQLVEDIYRDRSVDYGELAIDMENSGIVMSPLVPWNISASIPLMMLEVGAAAIPYAVLLYVIPLCYGLTKTHFYSQKECERI